MNRPFSSGSCGRDGQETTKEGRTSKERVARQDDLLARRLVRDKVAD